MECWTDEFEYSKTPYIVRVYSAAWRATASRLRGHPRSLAIGVLVAIASLLWYWLHRGAAVAVEEAYFTLIPIGMVLVGGFILFLYFLLSAPKELLEKAEDQLEDRFLFNAALRQISHRLKQARKYPCHADIELMRKLYELDLLSQEELWRMEQAVVFHATECGFASRVPPDLKERAESLQRLLGDRTVQHQCHHDDRKND